MAEKQKYACDSVGNIIGIEIPDYNKITEDDDMLVAKAKKKKQIEQWEAAQSE